MGRGKKGWLLALAGGLGLYFALLLIMRFAVHPAVPVSWKLELPGRGFLYSATLCPDGNLFCVTGLSVLLVSPAGKFLSDLQLPGREFVGGVGGETGGLFVGGTEGYVYSFNPDGSLGWELQLPELKPPAAGATNRNTSCFTAADGGVIVMLETGELARISADGNLLGHTALPFGLSPAGGIAQLKDDRLAVVRQNTGSWNNEELAVIGLDGTEVWSGVLVGRHLTTVTVIEDVIVVFEYHGGIHGVDFSGNILWSFHNPDPGGSHTYHHSESVEVIGDNIIYYSGSELFAMDKHGRIDWQVPNRGVALPLTDSGGRLWFVEHQHSDIDTPFRNLVNRYTPLYISYPEQELTVNLVQLTERQVTRRFRLPDFRSVDSILGPDGQLYLAEFGSHDNTESPALYRIDF